MSLAWRVRASTSAGMPGRLALLFSGSRHGCGQSQTNHSARGYAAAAAEAAGDASHRVALVTGSSRGLGLEFARQLLQRPNQR